MLLPMFLTLSVTFSLVPAPRASIAITAATPMITPSIVRKDRSLFAAMLFIATTMIVQTNIISFLLPTEQHFHKNLL
jgi:hypothetical protein